jgi:hypothetical protein
MRKEKKKSAKSCSIRYSIELKEEVCREFLKGGVCKTDLEKKYKIGHGRVLYWLQECGYLAKNGQLTPKRLLMARKKSKSIKDLPPTLRVKELEKALEQANLQSEAYRLMIEVAERELKIEIRKK